MANGLRPMESALQSASASLRERPASGQLHVIEMDAASVAAIERWPWSREHYGRVVDRLSAVGVRSIVFDVDFSTPSTPQQDWLFAQSLARADPLIVLPTFAQQASFGTARALDALPIEILQPHAALASVSVRPDSDGLVRKIPLGTMTDGIPRPSLSAQVANRSGAAGEQFSIDFSIDPDTIPRHSFVAIERGLFDPDELRGKDVLIGATAIEMGDRYVVPRHGVIPGVLVQALAVETLYGAIPVAGGWFPLLLLAGALSVWLLGAHNRDLVAKRSILAAAAILLVKFGAIASSPISFEIAPALMVIAVTGLAQAVQLTRAEMLEKRLHDPESGLPNRRALEMNPGGIEHTYTVAAMIDRYDALKTVLGEDHIGRLVGRLAERLRNMGLSDVIYRVDDRVLAWTVTCDLFELEESLEGLKAVMRAPIEIEGRRADIALFYGIAGPGAATEAAHAASVALSLGTNLHIHQAAGRVMIEEQVTLMGELDEAIAHHELEVLYQPKLALSADRITSVEALVRWNHPDRGFLRPDSFIPMAEQSDRIDDLTLFVLRRTIDDLMAWHSAGLDLRAAVNISAKLVTSLPFVKAVDAAVTAHPGVRDRLIFEITESATIADPNTAFASLEHFRSLGIAISMDDYGTGQSSLAYLQKLPLAELKIDRSFVQFAYRDKNDALLVRSTVQLAHALGLEVVAEGVEDAECLAFLRSIDCDYAQGYLIGKPMSAIELQGVVKQQLDRAAAADTFLSPLVRVSH